MITVQHAKESLCRSYLTAIAAVARHNIWVRSEHDYGVDGTFRMCEKRGKRHRENGTAIDFQAKSSVDWFIDGADIVYDLEAKSYNDLVERSGVPRTTPFILVLLCLNRDPVSWLSITEDRMLLQKTAYFTRLSGPSSKNTSTERIRIPKANHVTPESLTALLVGVRTGTILP